MRNSEEELPLTEIRASISRDSLDSTKSASSDKSPSLRSDSSSLPLEHHELSSGDVEAQTEKVSPVTPPEDNVPLKIKLLFLFAWFALNLILTISNKAVLRTADFPWLLTLLHTSSTSIGCFILKLTGHVTTTDLGRRESLIMLAFSFLFTLNIAMSNISLSMVSVPFHQIMRSTCPIVTILIYRLVYNRTYTHMTYLSMVPLILGVALATAGDYYFTLLGFLLTALGVVLASVKTVATNRLMTGTLKLSPLEVLLRMSPLAALQCILYALVTGEVAAFRTELHNHHYHGTLALMCLGNGLGAFALNVVSFQTNKLAGALAMAVAGNVKQTLTIVLGLFLFNVQTGVLSVVGMCITVCGAAFYSKVELERKREGR